MIKKKIMQFIRTNDRFCLLYDFIALMWNQFWADRCIKDIINDLCEDGDLDYLLKKKGFLDEETIKPYLRDILRFYPYFQIIIISFRFSWIWFLNCPILSILVISGFFYSGCPEVVGWGILNWLIIKEQPFVLYWKTKN